ncbi:ABC transporter ATP-binding protein [Sporosarcina sp. FSL W7-1349]|uniref:ABC transporter ATP-binding protein n=1 Tax=Sporosarcina sp. FSL W7-1349 TaxID=2921561 RepID=UPI0030FA882C
MSLLTVNDLTISFNRDDKEITPVDRVSFQVNKGETVCLVGESGSGKSVTSLSIMRLIEFDNGKISEGDILFEGRSILNNTKEEMRLMRGKDIAMIFQEPMTALNPVVPIGNQLVESILLHKKIDKKSAKLRAVELLELVGISDAARRFSQYPHELSGGMRQRVMIAMALSCDPKLLIADEPTTALDVTIEAQILKLLNDLKDKLKMSIIFITHDMGVAAEIADRIVVMYAGKVVEDAEVFSIFEQPLHPYTEGLLRSIPSTESDRNQPLLSIKGSIPALANMPTGCRFHPRCEYATEKCFEEEPPLMPVGQHRVACWNYERLLENQKGCE